MAVEWVPKGSPHPGPTVSVDVDAAAEKRLKEILDFDDWRGKALRVVIACATCGDRLTVSPAEPEASDVIWENEGVKLLADLNMRKHLHKAGGLVVRYVKDPFTASGILLHTAKYDPCNNPACKID